jgi:DNA-binding SARP family transcriptional activator/tetratricopeptide (TPR) repeat protein
VGEAVFLGVPVPVDGQESQVFRVGQHAGYGVRPVVWKPSANLERSWQGGGMVTFRLLGDVSVHAGGAEVDVGHARQRDVLVVLLVEANRLVPLDDLVDRVWGEHPPRRPKDALYSYLSRLRVALAGCAVRIDRQGGGYRLAVDPMSVDLHRFQHLVEDARSQVDDRAALERFDEALGLWRGRAFAGLDSVWLNDTRAWLDRKRLAAELDRNDVLLRTGQHARVVAETPAEASLDERLAGQLMLALHRSGRQADALRHFEHLRARLADELGVDPGPELRHVHQQVLTSDTSTAQPAGPRQLPAAPPSFRGRTKELAELDGTQAAVRVITGGGGAGKTWLALRWAHEHAGEFPDGQLYVNLRGFEPTGEPMPAATALRGFLEALGISPSITPADPDAQAARYRGLTAGRRMLIVLDNARDTAQLTPLLPSGDSCVVLITSRNRLTGLLATHGASSLALPTLSDGDATELLTARLGPARLSAEPEAVAEILRHCAGLPLALGIASARAATQPELPLAGLAAELRDDLARLDALDSGELSANLRAVFDASYRALEPEPAQAFRLLGAAPGPDIGVAAATRLLGKPTVLRELTAMHLVQEHRTGRYRMHDLVRLYATELPGDVSDLADLIDYYLHAAWLATDLFSPQESYRRPPLDTAVSPAPEFTDYQQARTWLDDELPVLLAVAALLRPDQALHLAVALYRYLDYEARHHDAISLYTTSLDAADPDDPWRGWAFCCLGRILGTAGRNDEARESHESALRLAGDDILETIAAGGLATIYEQTRDYEKALDYYEHAVETARRSGEPHCIGIALNNLGDFYRVIGQADRAAGLLRQSLDYARELADAGLGAVVLSNVGQVHQSLRQYETATEYFELALRCARLVRHRVHELEILLDLGETTLAGGNPAGAADLFRQAIAIAGDLGARPEETRARKGLAETVRPD